MSEFESTPRSNSNALLAALAVALLAGVGGLIWTATVSSRVSHQETALADANQQNLKMAAELRETNARLEVATQELGKSMGLTQKQMDARADDIIARENAANARLESAQKQTAQQVSSVSNEVSNVKTDVGGVKNDVGGVKKDLGQTRTDLAEPAQVRIKEMP